MTLPVRLTFLGLTVLFITLLSSCGGSSERQIPPTDPVPRQGTVRFINAIPDAPPLLAIRNGSATSSVAFGDATALESVLVGNYVLQMDYSNVEGVRREIVPPQMRQIVQDDEINLVATGTFANPSFVLFRNPEFLFGIRDPTFTKSPEVQFVHGASSRTRLDFYLTDVAAPLTGVSPNSSLDYSAFTSVTDVPASATYRLRITAAGSTQVLYDSGSFGLPSTTRTHFVVFDYFGPGGNGIGVTAISSLGAFQLPEQVLPNALRVANFIGGSNGAVDVHFGDPASTPIVASVGPGAFSSYINIAAISTAYSVTASGTNDPVLYTSALNLQPGVFNTLYLTGRAADTSILGSLGIDSFRVPRDRALLRLFSRAASAGSLDVYVLLPGQTPDGNTTPFAVVSRGSNTSSAVFPGSYDVTITQTGTQIIVFGPQRVTVDEGGIYQMSISDQPDGGPPVDFSFSQLPSTPP